MAKPDYSTFFFLLWFFRKVLHLRLSLSNLYLVFFLVGFFEMRKYLVTNV